MRHVTTNHCQSGGVLAPMCQPFGAKIANTRETFLHFNNSEFRSMATATANRASSCESSVSGSPPGSPSKDPSFLSDSDTTPTKDQWNLRLGSMKDLKQKCVGEWNDTTAHVVYNAFGVKRYKVDEEYILCPVGSPALQHRNSGSPRSGRTSSSGLEFEKISEILEICDEQVQENPKRSKSTRPKSWLEFEPKMDQILEVFRGEAHLLSSGLTDTTAFFKAQRSLVKNMTYIKNHPADDPVVRDEESELHQYLRDILGEIRESLEKGKPHLECFFESYFQYLLEMCARISGLNIGCYKSIMFKSFEITLSSFGTVPRPDFFLTRGSTILAVLEVKSGRKLHFASHKGHRPKSYKDRQNLNHDEKDSATDEVCPEKKMKLTAVDKDTDEDMKESDAEGYTDEKLNDTFDAEETQLEETRKESLGDHVKHLDFIEKKQIRCFMPQLLGQMLACTSVKDRCVQHLQHPYMTQIFGIGMVGFQVQMVMLVLKDSKKKILSPTVNDLETSRSIKPYLYVTRRLNLFKEQHLRVIFRTLFALGIVSRL